MCRPEPAQKSRLSTRGRSGSNVAGTVTGREMAKKTVIKRKSGAAKAAKKSAKMSSGRAGAKAKKAVSRKPAKARPPKGPVWQWSALQTAAAIRSGAISSIEVVEAH